MVCLHAETRSVRMVTVEGPSEIIEECVACHRILRQGTIAKTSYSQDAEPPKDVGRKYDAGKARYGLVPPLAMDAFVRVLTFGAKKYGPDNWRLVEDWRYVDAAFRHMFKRLAGQKIDKDSGEDHYACVMCNIAFLLEKAEAERLKNQDP